MKCILFSLLTAVLLFSGGCHWAADDVTKGGSGVGKGGCGPAGCGLGGCAACAGMGHCHSCDVAGDGHISGDILATLRGHHGANIAHTPGAAGSYHHHRSGVPGPPSAQATYPYYTTRGPRDFFVDQPTTIGY